MTTIRICQVHGADCANEVVSDLMPDGWSMGAYCWDGYAVLCDREREYQD